MNYPRCLPPPLAAGYDLDSPDDWLRSEMDGGLTRVRRRDGVVPRKVGVHWLVTGLDAATLDAWLRQAGGAWQAMTLHSPQGVVDCRARRVGPWSSRHEKTWWRVSATFETLPIPPRSEFEGLADDHRKVVAAYTAAEIDRAATARRWAAGHYPSSHYF